MGDETQFHGGKKHLREGLEFIGAPKKSKFRHFTIQAEQQRAAHPEPGFSPLNDEPFFSEADLLPDVESDILAEVNEQAADKQVDSAIHDIPDSHIQRPTIENDKENLRKKIKLFLSTAVTVLAIAVLVVSGLYIKANQPVVTKQDLKKMGIPLYYMQKNGLFRLDRKSITIDSANSFVFIAYNKKTNDKYVVSQQKVPDIIKEDAQFQQFLGESDKYAILKSNIGTAYFTKPSNLGDDVSAVVKNDSNLLFIRGPGTTSEDVWASFISFLKVAK